MITQFILHNQATYIQSIIVTMMTTALLTLV